MSQADRFLLALLLFTSLALLTGGCSAGGEHPSSLTYGLTLAPTGIDPHINASVELGIPLSSVYDTLVYQDPDSGAFVAGLAERWTISEDGLAYTFYLRSDVHFHDGTAFDAEAVGANFEYVLDPDHHSQKAALMLGPLEGAEAIAPFTVVLHLSEPYAPLLDSLSQVYLGMASPSALETWGPTEYQFHQVGTGPYEFVDYIPNDRLRLKRNPDYGWGPSIYHARQASVETIVFRFYEDPATRALALQSGEVDVIGEVPPNDARRLSSAPEFDLHPVPIPGQPLQFFFNTRRAPTDDVRVRQALVLGVDRERIVKTVFGSYSPVASGPLSAVTYGYAEEHKFPGYDPERASAILTEAGWTRSGEEGRRSKEGVPLELLIVVPPWGSNPEVGQLVKSDWEAMGAQVSLQLAPGFGPLRDSQSAGDYHAIGLNFFGTDPDLLRPFYASDGYYNWSGFSDPGLDQALYEAARSADRGKDRLGWYAYVADRVQQEWLILPIRDYVDLVVANHRVQGLRFAPQGWFPYLIDLKIAP